MSQGPMTPPPYRPPDASAAPRSSRWPWLITAGAVLVALAALGYAFVGADDEQASTATTVVPSVPKTSAPTTAVPTTVRPSPTTTTARSASFSTTEAIDLLEFGDPNNPTLSADMRELKRYLCLIVNADVDRSAGAARATQVLQESELFAGVDTRALRVWLRDNCPPLGG